MYTCIYYLPLQILLQRHLLVETNFNRKSVLLA